MLAKNPLIYLSRSQLQMSFLTTCLRNPDNLWSYINTQEMDEAKSIHFLWFCLSHMIQYGEKKKQDALISSETSCQIEKSLATLFALSKSCAVSKNYECLGHFKTQYCNSLLNAVKFLEIYSTLGWPPNSSQALPGFEEFP